MAADGIRLALIAGQTAPRWPGLATPARPAVAAVKPSNMPYNTRTHRLDVGFGPPHLPHSAPCGVLSKSISPAATDRTQRLEAASPGQDSANEVKAHKRCCVNPAAAAAAPPDATNALSCDTDVSDCCKEQPQPRPTIVVWAHHQVKCRLRGAAPMNNCCTRSEAARTVGRRLQFGEHLPECP